VIDGNTNYLKEIESNPDLLEQEKRIITNLHGSLIKHFQDVVSEYQIVQSDIKNIK